MSDISLYYERQGSGPPLLLLHGNGEDGTYFCNQIKFFAKEYTVYTIDTRGHGKSPRGTASFGMKQFAQDLLDFMDEHRLERANILGFSDGGNIALTFALAHPERVEKLILNGANLNAAGVKAHIQIPIVLGYKLASLFAKRDPKAMKNAEVLGLMVNEPNISQEALAGLAIPTLVIVGTNDMIKPAHSRLIADSLPNSRFAELPGDHFIAAKNPDAFNQTVEQFLNDYKE